MAKVGESNYNGDLSDTDNMHLPMKRLHLLRLKVSRKRKKETWERKMYQRDLFDPPKIWVAELDWEKVLEYYSLSDSLQVLTTEDILTTIITLIVSCTCNYVCVCVYTSRR